MVGTSIILDFVVCCFFTVVLIVYIFLTNSWTRCSWNYWSSLSLCPCCSATCHCQMPLNKVPSLISFSLLLMIWWVIHVYISTFQFKIIFEKVTLFWECAPMDFTVKLRNISGMLLCWEAEANQTWDNYIVNCKQTWDNYIVNSVSRHEITTL